MKKLRVGFKLWLSTGVAEGVFGDGKWRLLRALEEKGSLRAACESLRISYRKAWGDLNKAEDCLGASLLERQRGGSNGGRTCLTEQGKAWVKAYSKFRGEVEKAAEKAFKKHVEELTK